MVLWKNIRDIHLNMPEELLFEIEEAAKQHYMSRSQYIRSVLNKAVGGKYPKQVQEAAQDDLTRFLDVDDS